VASERLVSLPTINGGSIPYSSFAFLNFSLEKAYPEYIELLAQVTSVQTSPGLNGCCLTAQGPSQSPEQLMEAILEGLGATKGLGGSLGQTCITVQEEVHENYMHDPVHGIGVNFNRCLS
jgi:hypothetical protein